MREKIKNILHIDNFEKFIDKKLTIAGWVKTLRDQKKFCFFEVNDGSTLKGIQVVIDADNKDYEKVQNSEISAGVAIKIFGKIVKSPAAGQSVEMVAETVEVYGPCDNSYPLQKKRHSFEFLRTIAHLRPRTNTQGAIIRVRNALAYSTHKFFQERGFFYINTPIITGADCEGGGELFQVTTLTDKQKVLKEINYEEDFFKKKAYLTVSGQLNAEIFACSMSDVYTFGPTFRAENSHTSRHLAEFWMMEPEMAFCDLKQNIENAESYIKYVLSHVLENCKEDILFFNKFIDKNLLQRLENVITSSFKIIEYSEAIEILKKSNKKFSYMPEWGHNLQSEHERYLCEDYFKLPTVVINYPKKIKAFYMRDNDDGKTVAAMDILVPQIGELVGGAQREERYDILKKKFKEFNLDEKEYWWYLELRKFGTVPHSGYGVGFERLVQFTTGMENIRDVIPFPRTPGNVDF